MTTQQKTEKQQRDSLKKLALKIKSDYSFGRIKCYKDLLLSTGYDVNELNKLNYQQFELDKPITFHDILYFIEDLRLSLEAQIFLKNNPPDTSDLAKPDYFLSDKNKAITEGATTIEELPKELQEVVYELEPSPFEKAFLFWFQKKCISEVLTKLLVEHKRAVSIIAATGVGKTFIAGAIFRRLLDKNFTVGKTFTPFPYVYVTKASVVEQTKRVLLKFFGITSNDVLVINYDQLRSEFGKLFVKEEVDIVQGEEHVIWKWRKNLNPIVILWDEFHALKNDYSQQSKIGCSFNDIESDHTVQIFMSATPFTRVSEAKCFSIATRVPFSFGGITKPLNSKTWSYFAEKIASPNKPEVYSPASVDRLMTELDDYIVRVKGVKPQFHAENSVKLINFTTKEGQDFYDNSWQKFLEKKAKIEGEDSLNLSQTKFQILAQLTIFRIAAESNPDRIRYIAKRMYDLVQNGKAAVCAVNFKTTIVKIVKCLIEEYHVPRHLISLIWGGGQTVNKKQKLKYNIEANTEVLAMLAEQGITMEDLDLDDIEAKTTEDLPDEYKLGIQSLKQRQIEIDRFQSGKSLYCLYTLRAGGVGLSLHHTDEFTTQKVGHKESGYAIEEDIPKIPTRPREAIVAPTYSAIELVQGLGRVPRLTSLSSTPQILTFFKGTIEERVARIVSIKLRCLSKVVRQKESWESVIIGQNPEQEEVKYIKNTPEPDTADELINEPSDDDNGKNV